MQDPWQADRDGVSGAADLAEPPQIIGAQLEKTVLRHLDVIRDVAARRAIRGLDKVGIPRAKNRMGAYPHEFSVGMRQ